MYVDRHQIREEFGSGDGKSCQSYSHGWLCTRRPDHDGLHVATKNMGKTILAVWT